VILNPRPFDFTGAQCTGRSELWFSVKADEIRMAKCACRICPCLSECHAYVMANPQEVGVWGGLSELDRIRIRRNPTADRGGALPKPIDHGSTRGYHQHWRRGEEPCEQCRTAYRENTRRYRLERVSA
jgi:hypothetical protein